MIWPNCISTCTSFSITLSLFSFFFFFSLMQTNVVNANDCFTHFFWVYNQLDYRVRKKVAENLFFFSSKPVTSTQFLLKMLFFFFLVYLSSLLSGLSHPKISSIFASSVLSRLVSGSDYDFLPHTATLIAFNNVGFYEEPQAVFCK